MKIINSITIATVLTILILLSALSCTKSEGSAMPSRDEPVSQSQLLLGTICRISLYDTASEEVFSAAFSRIRQIEQEMSVTIPDSEISHINDTSGSSDPVTVSEDTYTVLQRTLEIARISHGAFDPSIGPLVRAWGIGTDHEHIPSPEEITTALQLTDYRAVETDDTTRTVYLPHEGMKLDLGGIAKGYAADEARTVLRREGVTSAIINLGGNILTVGSKPDGTPWKIGIQDPSSSRGTYIMVLSLVDKAVVTSGPYERFFEVDGVRYHHILDTSTGYPVASRLTSVSIIAPDSCIADALSTTVYALGLDAGLDLIERYEGIEAIIITEDDEIFLSSGLRDQRIPNKLVDTRYTIQ